MPNADPELFNYDKVAAAAGTGPIDLRIAVPIDPDLDALTITLDGLPAYGVVEYFDGASWVAATAGQTLTAAELASLRYTPPAFGEFGGGSLSYSVFDGTATVQGTMTFSSQVDSTGPANLIFSAFSGAPQINGDLFTVDAGGALTPIPINAPSGSLAGDNGGFIQFAGNLYFHAFTAAVGGEVLFKMAPNGTVTPVDDGSSGYYGDVSEDAHFTVFAGSLYFRAISGSGGDQLVKLNADGSSETIVLHSGGQAAAPGALGGFVEFNGSLYFSALTDLTGINAPNLIKLDSDGTVTEIAMRAGANGSYAGENGGFVVFDNALYFNAFGDAAGSDTLYRLDPGSTTPVPVDPAGSLFADAIGVNSAFHVFGGALYFSEFSYGSGAQGLFRMDGSGTVNEVIYYNQVILQPLVNAGALGGFVDFAGSTYFVATASDTGTDLFRMDANGNVTAIDVNPGSADAFDDNLVSGFVVFDGSLYFSAYDSGGDSLYQITADGDVSQFYGLGGTTLAGVEGGFQVANGSLYFSAYTADGYELVKLDSDGTSTSYDINPGPGDNSEPGSHGGFGLFPRTVLNGTGGNDILVGGAFAETLNGGSGNDVLEGRTGNDTLTGGDGADIFKVSELGPGNIDSITDYNLSIGNLALGDSIDLSALLDANFPIGGNVADFVRVAVGHDVIVQVDVDGPGGSAGWTDAVVLPGANTVGADTVKVYFGGAEALVSEGDAHNVRTVALAGGGWAVSWTQSAYQDGPFAGTYYTVYARVYDADGQPVGSTIRISDPADNMEDNNSILTALPCGNFAVTWENCLDSLQTRVYDASGTEVTAGIQWILDIPDFNRLLSSVTPLSNGGYAVLWDGVNADNDFTVFVRTYDSSGNPLSGVVSVDDPLYGIQNRLSGDSLSSYEPDDTTQIVKLANGFAVLWVSPRDDGGGDFHQNVFVRVFQNDGTPVSGEIQVNGPDGAYIDFANEIVALGGDDFAIQWETDDASGASVYTRIFKVADYTAGTPERADANADPLVGSVPDHLLALAGGGYAALWTQYDVGNGSSDIYVQVRDANGAIAAGSQAGGTQVNTVSDVVSFPEEAVALPNGGFAVLFEAMRDDGTGVGVDSDVYVRLYAADGTAGSEILVNAPDAADETGLQVLALADGSLAVLWSRYEATANGHAERFFLQNIAADGTKIGSAIALGTSPSDLTLAQEESYLTEFRAAVAANGAILAGAIAKDSLDLANFFYGLGLTFGPSAHADAVSVAENAVLTGQNVLADNGSGADAGTASVVAVAGGTLGPQFTLPSGALLTLNADGTLSYDPNHAFDSLHLAAPGSSAVNTSATDTFTYTLDGGSFATVTVTVEGVNNGNTIYYGGAGPDTITGDPTLPGLYHLEQGGSDSVTGGSGNDGFYFGAEFDATDQVNGGGGTNDQIGLEGDYSAGLTLGALSTVGVEVIACLPSFSYKLITVDDNVAAGARLTIWAVRLPSANTLDFNGAAELDGKFTVYGGAGNDTIVGGQGDDILWGLGGADSLTGNGGADSFTYNLVSQSTGDAGGTIFDTINGFDALVDKFDLPGAVSGIDATVATGSLSAAGFDIGLGLAVTPSRLAAGHAVLFTPDAGSWSGHTFLIVDANGDPGYQSGADFVFELNGATNLGSLAPGAFI